MNPRRFRIFPIEAGYAPFGLLLNMAIPLFFLIREPTAKFWPGLVMLILFVLLFRQLYWTKQHVVLILSIQIVITLTLAAIYHPMYAYIGFLVALPLSELKPKIIAAFSVFFAVGMGSILILSINEVPSELWFALIPPIFGVCILPFIIGLSTNYKQMAERLQAATMEIERMAQQEERQRIARELHDTLGHTLSLISLKSEVTQKLIPRDQERAIWEARDIQETARAALKQMRELVTEMRVVRLDEEYRHALTLCAAAGITLEIKDPYIPEHQEINEDRSHPLSVLQETIIAMCLREALTNVVRHSRADHCTITLAVEESQVRLVITDDGIGIETNKQNQATAGGNGLAGIRERLILVDGNVHISSSKDSGTVMTILIPRVIRNQG